MLDELYESCSADEKGDRWSAKGRESMASC